MPKFVIRTINSSFFTEVELEEKADADSALAECVNGALMIAAEEIRAGGFNSVVEAIVEDAAGQQVRKSAVSISIAPLATGPVEERAFPQETNDR